MENNSMQSKQSKSDLMDMMWLYGLIICGLASLGNLALFLRFHTSQMLAISGGAIVCAGVFLFARRPQRMNRIYLSAVIANIAWSGFFVIHEPFWAGIYGALIAGAWVLPAVMLMELPAGFRRFIVFLPSVAATISIIVLEQSPVFERITVTEFAFSRFISPVYFFLFGTLLFLIVLRGFRTRRLSTRMIASMTMIVFIPIVIISMVTFSNTRLNDNMAAVNALDQIAARKGDEIEDWSRELSDGLADILGTVDNYSKIVELFATHARGELSAELFYRQAVATILIETMNRSGFDEVHLMDSDGIVVTSTHGDLIGTDQQYSEFFWQGKLGATILTPRYYPPEDEVSIFVSLPVLDYAGEVIGVLSGRATVDRMIEIISVPALQPYQSTLVYMINTDGTLLVTSKGRSETHLQTEGAQSLLTTHKDGNGSYTNIDDLPVIGVYRWLPDLKVGILVEASEAEVYQRLPGVITSNLAIGVIAFFLAAIAAITIVRTITSPINELVKASQDVVDGNLDIRVEIARDDELGILTESFNKMTGELNTLVTGLEMRVAERTHDLEQRSLELQTAAQIARDASMASNINDLLDRTVSLIRERFGFYHVGIFLNDESNEYAVLRAAGGDAGRIMLANNHKLKIGEVGIVGSVAKSGEPRIALDVGADSIHFRNPLLPYTRSEMALPLMVGARLIGVLDVQSDKINAFDQNDVTIMSILTDQLAIAIERTRLLQESSQNAAALELALQAQTSRAWREYIARTRQAHGYRYEGVQVEPLMEPDELILKGIASGKPVIVKKETGHQGCVAAIPIQLRGQTLGVLNLQFTTDQISAETLHLLEEAANRLSLALENARLVEDAQRLASQEQQINIITGQIQQSTNLETILQNTIRELGKTLGVPKTFIQIGLASPKKTNDQ